jgi:hypothetical protein
MVWIEVFLVTALAGLGVLVAVRQRAAAHRIEACATQLRRSAARLTELRRLHEMQRRLADAQQLAETAIDVGTATVRAIHFGIAGIPFGILDMIPPTRATARIVRRTHDLIANAVYGTIRSVSRISGEAAREVLGTAELRQAEKPAVTASIPPPASAEEKDAP